MAEHCPYKLVPHTSEPRYSSPYPVEGPDGAVYDFNDEYDARRFVHDMNHAYTLGWRAGAREPPPGIF